MGKLISRNFLFVLITACLPFIFEQNSYAEDYGESSFSSDTVFGLLGVGAAVGVGLWEYNKHNQNDESSPTPGPTPPTPPVVTGGPVILSSNIVNGTTEYTNYNLQITPETTSAIGKIFVLNTSKSTQQFTITSVNTNSDIVIDPNSSCYSSVNGGNTCSFNISFTPASKIYKNITLDPVLYRITGTTTNNSDYITINPSTTNSNVFYNPAVVGTDAHSIQSVKITALLNIPRNGIDVLYTATDGYGIFASTDGGISSIAMNNGITLPNISAITTDGKNIYAAAYKQITNAQTQFAIYKSSNNGASWTDISNNIPTNFVPHALAWDGTNLYVGGTYTVCTTTRNNGTPSSIFIKNTDNDNWKGSSIDASYIYSLFFDGQNLYAGAVIDATKPTTSGGIYKKATSGDTWNQFLPGSTILSIAGEGNLLYAVKTEVIIPDKLLFHSDITKKQKLSNNKPTIINDVMVSSNGESWTNFASVNNAFSLYPYQNYLYIGTLDGTVLRAPQLVSNVVPEDVSNGLYYGFGIGTFASDSTNLYAGSFLGGGAYQTQVTNKKNNFEWNALPNGLADVSISAIQETTNFANKASTVFFVGTQDPALLSGIGVYKSTDSGANWIPDNAGFTSNQPLMAQSLYVFDNKQDIDIFVGFHNSLGAYKKSLLGPGVWNQISELAQKSVTSFVGINSQLNQAFSMFAGTWMDSANNGVYRSDDGGAWNPSGSGIPASSIIDALAISSQNRVYAADMLNGIYNYQNLSGTWQWVNDAFPTGITPFALNLFNANLYAGSSNGVYIRASTPKLTNASPWSSFNSGDLTNPIQINALFSQAGDGYLYAGGSTTSTANKFTLFRIAEATGQTWAGLGGETNNPSILSLAGFSNVTNLFTTLYAGTYYQGVQKIFIQNSSVRK
ncbi:MAG: hypothetical protein M1561_07320 [Gammaproteobacteria bacterium]|nr:hypothetical protein [Gammaproteobacteria bacterium]